MDDELELTRAQLAQRIGFSESVLRKWERVFSDFITSPPGIKGLPKSRLYNRDDVVLLSIVAQMRSEGFSLDAIRARLPDRLAQARAAIDEGVANADDYMPRSTEGQSVALTLHVDLLRRMEAVEGTLTAVESERDYLRERLQELEDRLLDAERRAASAEAQRDMLAARPPSFLQRLFGGGPKPES